MKEIRFKDSNHLYNNNISKYLILVTFLFLPFTYALTIPIGFPLKISEVSIVLTLIFSIIYIYKNKDYRFLFPDPFFYLLLIFLILAVLSFCINSFWTYEYSLQGPIYRFTSTQNSFLKTVYLVLIFASCLFSFYCFLNLKETGIRFLFAGGIISSLYGWYLFLFSLNNYDVFLLPGMDEWPQHGLYSFGHFIRSGTFKEGNYAGLFFLSLMFIAINEKKHWLAFFFGISIVPTVSITAIISLITFAIITALTLSILKKNYVSSILIVLVVVTSLFITRNHKDSQFAMSKITIWKKADNPEAENSKNERLFLIKNAFEIGKENPFFGVGLSNFNAHLSHFGNDPDFDPLKFKFIPNNVYLEIFSELGTGGLLAFMSLLFYLLKRSLQIKSSVLFSSTLAMMVYFLAYPTFSFLFLSVFWGYILAETHE